MQILRRSKINVRKVYGTIHHELIKANTLKVFMNNNKFITNITYSLSVMNQTDILFTNNVQN